MSGFRFRLASVLRYRERVKELRVWDLHVLEAKRNSVIFYLAELEQLVANHREAMERQIGKRISVLELRLQGDFIQRLVEKISEQRRLIAELDQKLEEKRAEVIQADMEMKSLDRLRSRLQEKQRRLESRDEQKLIDEAAQQRHAQKN